MSTTAQGTSIRCDNPTCSLPATVEEGVYGYCATHARGGPAVPQALGSATPASSRPDLSRAHTPAPPAASAPLVQVMGGGTIGLLLEQASGHSNRRVVTLAEKIEAHIEQLRTLVASLADDEKRKQTAIAAKAAAKAKIERLEAELAAARAALRSKPVSGTPDKPTAVRHVTDQHVPCRNGCGRTSPNPQGRAAHERHCTFTSGSA